MQILRPSSVILVPRQEILSRALVVDDSHLQRKILSASLVRWGFLVDAASSGAEALEICRSNPTDLVVCEWLMPNMNGLTFCQAFRAIATAKLRLFYLGELAQ